MIRYLIAAALALVAASPASAQTNPYAVTNCPNPVYPWSSNDPQTANDKAYIQQGVTCLTAERDKRVTLLTAEQQKVTQLESVIASTNRAIQLRQDRIDYLNSQTDGQGDSAPPPAGGTVSVGLPSIASNFTVASYIEPSHNYSDALRGSIAPSASPDVVGAFRFDCLPGQIAKDDPIVFPGRPGDSHRHQFFGNTGANAYSTFNSLRTTGESTCNNKLNRSAYWIPAMLNGKGGVVRPDFASIYYKRLPQTSPECMVQAAQGCVELPRGLRFIYGYDMRTMKAPATFEEGRGYFNCQGPGSTPGHYKDLVEVAKFCPVGAQLGIILIAPNCWDGKNLDVPDHRSHMGYALYSNGQDGHPHCPATHPYMIPGFQLGAWYTVDSDLDRSGTWEPGRATWSLASDDMTAMGMGQQRPGSTVHGDWWGAWDDSVMKTWTDNCINKKLNCSGGDLGNGTAIKNIPVPEFASLPRVVPIQ